MHVQREICRARIEVALYGAAPVASIFPWDRMMAYTVRLIDCTDSISTDDRAAISGQLNTWISAADSTRPTDKRLGVNVDWVTFLDNPALRAS
jgi:hypothetical protein